MDFMKTQARNSRRQFIQQGGMLLGAGLFGRFTAAHAAATAQPDSSTHYQIGCYTRPFDKFDWRAAYDAIAEAGYKYAGLISTNTKEWIMIRPNTTLEAAHEMGLEAAKRGLKLLSAYGDFSVAQSLQDGIAALQRLIDNCAAADCPNLLLGGVGEEKLSGPYFKAIAECCDYALAKKVGLSIKPHGGQNATGPQCRKAIEGVARKNFGLWYDPGNIYYYSNGELDPAADAPAVDGLVVGMSVKDYRHPKEVMLTPGTGKVNFPAVMTALRRGGFTQGPLLVECLTPGDLGTLTEEARKTRRWLEELIAHGA